MQLSNYWDIDQILSEEEKLHVEFQEPMKNVPQLKQLYDQASPDIESKYESDLPLWLVIVLIKKSMIRHVVPPYLNDHYQKALTADPISVNLKKKSLNFYYMGLMSSDLYILYERGKEYEKCIELLDVLGKVYSTRYNIIMDYTANGKEDLPLKVYKKLCNVELTLYQLKREAMRAYSNWKERKNLKMEVSSSVLHYNKKMKLAP